LIIQPADLIIIDPRRKKEITNKKSELIFDETDNPKLTG
jgi:hypothetical protein